mgnify:CR=1 FL=1
MPPTVTRVECIEFTYSIENMGEPGDSFYPGYSQGSSLDRTVLAIRIETDTEHVGTYVSLNSPPGPALEQIHLIAPYLVGKNPLERERHWSQFKMNLRKYDRMGIGPIDIALWDFAGKYYGAPVHELIGTYRKKLPTYASTAFGDEEGGLDSPEAYADFAEDCLERGYPAFKIHGWRAEEASVDVEREVETIHAVGERVGADMDLMYDPVGQLETFADAWKTGKACDEQEYLWWEDPSRDFGTSQHGSRRLGDLIDTPLLQTEHIRGLEPHTDFAVNDGTEYLRADPEYDAGITGVLKIARMAEGLGLDVEIHICGPAQRQLLATIRNSNYYEIGLMHPDHPVTHNPPIYNSGYSDGIDAIDDDGCAYVPDAPGVGVSYDWDFIRENSVNKVHFD